MKRCSIVGTTVAVVLAGLLGASLFGCRAAVPPDRPPAGFGEERPHPQARQEERRSAGDRYDQAGNRAGRDGRDEHGERDNHRRRGRSSGSGQSTPGEFDFYLLNLSWSPEFCATHPQSPECGAHLGFIVHGLWPQNNDGSYPEHCAENPGPLSPGAYRDFMPVASLVQHEWETHGTCSGQTPDVYFSMARKAFHEVAVPPQISHAAPETMLLPADILGAFAKANPSFPAGSIALSCGNNRLTAIEVCMSKTLEPIACAGIRSCRAQQVRITAP